MGGEIRFLLNNTEIRLTEAGSRDTLLDFLRLNRRLTGTKEGCAEGDCGACTVLVGRLHHGALRYEPINACIRFLASCHGCHVVTVEHLRGPDGGLHPVQAAMVEHHGSQCGFCTPGFVMALYGLWMQNPRPDMLAIETALQGNLCRCTGYEPIVKAAFAASEAGGQNFDALTVERDRVTAALAAIPEGGFWTKAAVLAVVAIGITVAVYGAVALIVKADDYGMALARTRTGFLAAAGKRLVKVMPGFMKLLMIVGTAAMIWVGGQIVVHGLHVLGQHQPYEWIHHMAEAAAQALPAAPGVAAWVTTAFFDGILGLMLGFVLIPVANHVITPAIGAVRGALGRA